MIDDFMTYDSMSWQQTRKGPVIQRFDEDVSHVNTLITYIPLLEKLK